MDSPESSWAVGVRGDKLTLRISDGNQKLTMVATPQQMQVLVDALSALIASVEAKKVGQRKPLTDNRWLDDGGK